MAIPSGFWASPTRMEVKFLLFAALFLVACVEFSSQDEVTDVEGEISTSFMFNPFFYYNFECYEIKKRLRLILPFDSRSDLINFLFKAPALQYAADNGK